MHQDKVPQALRFSDARRIVQAVFQEMAGDTRLAPRTRALLVALQPTARLAHPQTFLTRSDHPLRAAITGLFEIALGLGEYETVGTDAQFAALERFAAQLRDAGADMNAIRCIAGQVQAWVGEEARQACLARRRSEISERARVLGAMARAAIEREIEREIGQCRLPAAAEELLRDAWQRVLAHAWLEQGPEGAPWRDALGGLRRFIALWRTGAASLPRELGEELLAAVLRAGGDPLRAEILLQSVDVELGTWEPPAPVPALMQVEEQAAPDDPGVVAATAMEAVDALLLGSWIALRDASGGTRRLRLAMRCGEPEQLLLVDRHGRRAQSLGREQLAHALARGEALVLSSEDPVSRAVGRLRERLARRAIAA